MVVLKRRSDAERDGDNILALIRGTGISHNGQNAGLTAPSGPAQEQMIRRALKSARIKPDEVNYLEAHASGTEMGDTIEVTAATNVLGENRDSNNPLLLGSAKANLSHLEAAGGIAGLIKVILSLKNGADSARQIHFDEPSTHIPWDKVPARNVVDRIHPLAGRPAETLPRVSSLGNDRNQCPCHSRGQHSAATNRPEPRNRQKQQLLVISAKSPQARQRNLTDRYSRQRLEELADPRILPPSVEHFPERPAPTWTIASP